MHRDQLQGARVVVGVQPAQDRDGDVGVPGRAVVVARGHGELGQLCVQRPLEVQRQRRVGEPLHAYAADLAMSPEFSLISPARQEAHLRGDRVGLAGHGGHALVDQRAPSRSASTNIV